MASVEERIQQLNRIRETVQRQENQLNDFLQQLNWSKDKLPKQKPEIARANIDIVQTSNEHTEKLAMEQPKEDFNAVVSLCSAISQKQTESNTFTDLNKLRRDLKRRRVKYRTTKTAPLSYTEELRELINLQMDLVKNKD